MPLPFPQNSQKTKTVLLIKSLVLGLACYVIYRHLPAGWNFQSLTVSGYLILLSVLLLMPVNWALEVWRWKLSISQEGTYSWQIASRHVFIGLALNWILPFTTGDLLYRLERASNRWFRGWIIMVNRMFMLSITLVFGGFGLYAYASGRQALVAIFIGLLLVIAVVWGSQWRGVKHVRLSHKFLLGLAGISLLRYAIFTLQFYLLLDYFLPDVSVYVRLAGIGWVFLFRSILPGLFGNFGVREATAMVFFDAFLVDSTPVLQASLLMWAINSVMPSFVGFYMIWRNRFTLKI